MHILDVVRRGAFERPRRAIQARVLTGKEIGVQVAVVVVGVLWSVRLPRRVALMYLGAFPPAVRVRVAAAPPLGQLGLGFREFLERVALVRAVARRLGDRRRLAGIVVLRRLRL